MTSSRREILTGLAGGLGAAAFLQAPAAAKAPELKAQPAERWTGDGRLTVNRARATRIMVERGLDALVGATPINARYITNLDSLFTEMRHETGIIGVIPADPKQPVVAICSPVDLTRHAQDDREWPEVIIYTAPEPGILEDMAGRTRLAADDEVPAAMGSYWSLVPEEVMSAQERAWRDIHSKVPSAIAATPALGLRHALTELGVSKGRVGFDAMSMGLKMQQLGLEDLQPVDATNMFRDVRMVKTSVEVDRMRAVSRLNAGAVRATIAQAQLGMTEHDLQTLFFTELAKCGGRPNFLALGAIDGLRQGEVVAGEPFLVDGSGQFDGYCGDFGRTAVVGDPPLMVEKRAQVTGKLAQAIFEELKPGVSYETIRTRGLELFKKLGGDFIIGVNPHSVGLQHADDPRPDDPFSTRPNLGPQVQSVLQTGMVITVDLPSITPGWGSTHMESLILITEDGAEWLDQVDDPLLERATGSWS